METVMKVINLGFASKETKSREVNELDSLGEQGFENPITNDFYRQDPL
jgi:hypothetical protein